MPGHLVIQCKHIYQSHHYRDMPAGVIGSSETRACKVIKQRDSIDPLVLQACSVMCLDTLEIQFKHKIDQAIPTFRLNAKL